MALAGLRAGLLFAGIAALGTASMVAAYLLQERAVVAQDAVGGIGVASFEPSAADAPSARDGRIVLVTDRQGSYAEANAAIMRAIEQHCPDGRGYSTDGSEPAVDLKFEDWDKPSYPAGSRFSQSIRCQGPLPNEIALAAGTTDKRAEATVLRRLEALGAGTNAKLNVMQVPYYEAMPKYRAFDHALGAWIRIFSGEQCQDGQVVVNAIVVGSHSPVQPASNGHSSMTLGTALSCLPAAAKNR